MISTIDARIPVAPKATTRSLNQLSTILEADTFEKYQTLVETARETKDPVLKREYGAKARKILGEAKDQLIQKAGQKLNQLV